MDLPHESALSPERQPRLTRTQLLLIGTIIFLVIALATVIALAYLNINTATAFRAGYVLTNLANVQREISELHIETNRLLRDRATDLKPLQQQRDRIDKHIELAQAEAIRDAVLTSALRNIERLLEQYDYEIHHLNLNPTEEQFRSSARQLDSILDLLDKQVQERYGSEELSYYNDIEAALRLQRTSQALTVGLGGSLLICGVLLTMSVGRSISGEFNRAYQRLKDEVDERRRVETELRKQNAYLEALHETTLALMNRLEVADLLEAIVTRAAELVGTPHGYVYLVDPEGETLERRVGIGLFSHSLGIKRARGEGFAGQVWATGSPRVINRYGAWPDRAHTPGLGDETVSSVLAVPLTSGQEIVGVLGLAHTDEAGQTFDETALALVKGFAQLASIALDNARLFTQAQQAATVEERQRLARELHDAVTQTLFSASIIAEVLPRLWQTSPDEGRRRAEELRELTRGALAEMRTLLLELRPKSLSEAPIDELLHQLAAAATGRGRFPVDVHVDEACKLPLEIKVCLYRIAQEGLNNIVKHANAHHASIALHCLGSSNRVRLVVEDDGDGFDPTQTEADHLGLSIMCERAASIDAAITIESQPGEGTTVAVTWETAEEPVEG